MTKIGFIVFSEDSIPKNIVGLPLEQKRRNFYLFILFFLSVALIEGALILYTRINPPAAAPKKEAKTIHLHLAKIQPAPKPKPAPKPIPKPPKPKPIVKPKPKPKPKKIVKPKTIKKRKPLHQKRTHQKKVKKVTPKHVPTPPAPPTPEKTPPKAPPAPPPKTIKPSRPITSFADQTATASIRNAYLQKVREKIVAERYYPRRAKKLRHTGIVTIAFTIVADGSILDITVTRRSRHPDLDRAAVKTLERIGRFDPIPKALHTRSLKVDVPIRYILR